MKTQTSQPEWTQPGWFGQASSWIHDQLEKQGITVAGQIEQPHVRPWSTVLRVSTSAGNYFFKATSSVLMHEAAITQALSHWFPANTPTLIATDLQRGWMLMSDGGVRLREILTADRDIRHWEKLLPIFAELQIELVSHIQLLLAMGIPNRQLETLPAQYEQLLVDRTVLLIDQPEGLTIGEYHRLCDFLPHFKVLCEKLAGYQIPESIHHGDFHDGNIFITNGRYIFFDWGDSSIAHPFFCLRTVFVSMENTLQVENNDPGFERLRDAYLEPWTRYQPREQLLAGFKLAQILSSISSALGWYRVISSMEASQRKDYVEAIPSLLQEFLDNEVFQL